MTCQTRTRTAAKKALKPTLAATSLTVPAVQAVPVLSMFLFEYILSVTTNNGHLHVPADTSTSTSSSQRSSRLQKRAASTAPINTQAKERWTKDAGKYYI